MTQTYTQSQLTIEKLHTHVCQCSTHTGHAMESVYKPTWMKTIGLSKWHEILFVHKKKIMLLAWKYMELEIITLK